jgi:Tfp pilus assembly protein PilF
MAPLSKCIFDRVDWRQETPEASLPDVIRNRQNEIQMTSAAVGSTISPTNARHCFSWRHFSVLPLIAAALLAGCHSSDRLPDRNSEAYSNYLSVFYVGLAALQVGDDVRADASLSDAVKQVPGEPAAWADWGILALRQGSFDAAAQRLNRARDLAPSNDRIYHLLGTLESNRGNTAAAIENLRQAVKLNPANLRANYQLALEIERQGGEHSEAEFQQIMQQILAASPGNLAALLELSRIAAKRGDASTLQSAVARIATQSASWPDAAKQQLAALKSAAAAPPPSAAGVRTVFLRNVLMQVPDFRRSLAVLKAPPGEEAEPFQRFLRLPSPVFTPAAPDIAMRFDPQQIANAVGEKWAYIGAVFLSGTGVPAVVTANAEEVRLCTGATFPFPGGSAHMPPTPESILPIDFNYDFRTDLVLAGAGGLRFLRQDDPAKFTDVTAQTKLAKAVIDARYTGAWAVDIEADGDLDVILGSPSGLPTVLRNNGDGTFQPIHPFAGVSGIRQLVWADLDGDGNPDASLTDGTGHVHFFHNERSGKFTEQALPANLGIVNAIATADANHDGVLDLLAVEPSGAIICLSDSAGVWSTREIARVPNPAQELDGEVRLRIADLDNNGAFDLLLARVGPANGNMPGALVGLADEQGHFSWRQGAQAPPRVFAAADLNGAGRLDLLGLTSDGQPIQAVNHGTRSYHWQIIRPRAHQANGDQRINSFGIGGEIEIRSGLLLQMQQITGPELHFGLGTQNGAEVARILWPNGTMRAEFALKADQEVVTEQRLKGSCPFLFAFNGSKMGFVKDAVPWGSAIGLRINNLGTARIAATEEWYKIGHDQLVPHDGYYDLRITGELWETYYYDSLALMAVDHPAGTEIFTDERFSVPPVKLAVTTVAPLQPIARATDDRGNDVTATLHDLDGQYLDTFGRGQYQGVTRDHYVEIDLGSNAPTDGPLWLIARGWLHPSDSSINVAIAQGSYEQPRPLSLEIPDTHGHWQVAKPNLGFPAGRNKICLIDLTGIFRPGMPHKLRLRTNLEIYWDQIQWARGLAGSPIKIARLAPTTANLHYRGFSTIKQANPSSPELPDYNHVAGTAPRWRDLSGYYTRYGDVRELLAAIDDRYVIMNAGDELSLRFPEQPPPPSGWVRDYVIAGDGWIKDGDYNSTDSRTVQPLPYHARTLYDTPPGKLEDEWVYRHFPADWQNYQTRYITPDAFRNALRNEINP